MAGEARVARAGAPGAGNGSHKRGRWRKSPGLAFFPHLDNQRSYDGVPRQRPLAAEGLKVTEPEVGAGIR
jgi:hypothetical protein